MTNTKQKADENPLGWKGEDDTDSSKNCIRLPGVLSNSVVNVKFTGDNGNTLKLDVMRISGDSGRYYSILYDISTDFGLNGIFDFLDDFYAKRFGFFTSSKSTQAILLALHRLEKRFYSEERFDFRNYCETIIESSIEKVANDKHFSNVLGCRLSEGYSIGEESGKFYDIKHDSISIGNHMNRFGKELKKEFHSIMDEMDKTKFCCVCITNTEKIPQSFLLDPILGLPFVVYHKEFAEEYIKKTVREFVESSIFKSAEIDEITVDLWGLSPDVTIKELTEIIGEDGELSIDYESEEMEDNDMFLGLYKSLTFSMKSYKSDDDHKTIIGNV